MENIIDWLINNFFQLIGFEKYGLKEIFYSNGAGWAWDFMRDYLFSYKVWLLGVLPALLLTYYKPVFKNKKLINSHIILDAFYPLFNVLISVTIISTVVFSISHFYDTYLPASNANILKGQPLWIQALGIFIITDFMFYVHHRLVHEVKWLWYFHTIHHSQTDLNPLTTNRNHPFQSISGTIVRTLPIGFIGGEPTTWIVYLVLNNFWGYFIHSNVKMNLGFLKYIIVTPQYHRVHHSIEEKHFDKNYGERLIIWDWLFGSLYTGKFKDYPKTGVPDTEWIMEKNCTPKEILRAWLSQMIYPFIMIYKSILNYFNSFTRKHE